MTHNNQPAPANRHRDLDAARPATRRWRAWTAQEPALAGLSWDRFCAELADGSGDRKDELLTALIHIGRHDPAAVGVIVTALGPGVRSRIARHAPGLSADDAWSIAAEGMCAAIARGGVPTRFVASALLDAAKRHLRRVVEQESSWHRLACPVPEPPDALDPAAAEAAEPSGTLIVITAVRAGVLSRADAWLLHTTLIEDVALACAARRLGVSYEAAKKRRQRAGARWSAWWDPPTVETTQ